MRATNQEKVATAEAVSEKGRESAELSPTTAISHDRHWWEGGWRRVCGASTDTVQAKLKTAAQQLSALTVNLPGADAIQRAAQGCLTYPDLLSKLETHSGSWDDVRWQAIDTLRAQAYAQPGGPRSSKITHVLIVEDDDNWRKDVEQEVQRQLRRLELHEIPVFSVPHCDAARSKVQELEADGMLAICDLGLPNNQEEYERQFSDEPRSRQFFNPANGLKLLAEFRDAGARVVAITSQEKLTNAFINLSFRFDDFLLKGVSGWEQDLADRLRAWLLPIDPETLSLLVPTFDTRIRLGPVWVDLPPLAFEIVHALACAAIGLQPVTPAAFSRSITQPSAARSLRTVSLSQLQEDMCRADLSGLPENFMESDTFETNITDHVRKINSAIKQAFEAVDLRVSENRRLVEQERPGLERQFHLRCAEVDVVNSRAEYRERMKRHERPYGILVIEDDPVFAGDIAGELRRSLPEDSMIETASTYEEAIKKAKTLRPAVATLDLNLPQAGIARPEVGVELGQWLMENVRGIGIVVLTAETDPRLQRRLSRTIDADSPWSRLRNIDRLTKADSEWRPKLQLRVLRLLQEREAFLPALPAVVHCIQVDARDLQKLVVNGTQIVIPKTPNADRDLAILTLLASYDNQPLRRQAILDYWQEHGLTNGVNDPGQQLTDRIEFLRRKFFEGAGVAGNEIIASDGQSYRLQGFVELIGL